MLKENGVYSLSIIDMGHTGEGIGKIQGIPVFVDGALVGDKVRVRIVKRKKNYAVGHLVSIEKESEDRVEAMCSVAALCGGCQIMQMEYTKQLALKQKTVVESLRRIGGIESVRVEPILGMQFPFHYRNKSQYPVRQGDFGVEVGFFEKKTHTVVPVDACYIDEKTNAPILSLIKRWISEENISIYDEAHDTGNLRQVILRTSEDGNERMIIFVTKEKQHLKVQTLISDLKKLCHENRFTIVQNINERKTNVIMGRENRILFGSGKIQEKLHRLFYNEEKKKYEKTDASISLKYGIYPSSFFQVNTIQTELLYSIVMDYASPSSKDVVFDLYCGLGSISLFLAKEAGKVYGVEIVEEAVQGAVENAALNGVTNAEFEAGKTEDILPMWVREGKVPNVVVLDPPRKGCEESVLRTIVEVCPKKIVYVSCNPATLARDLKFLVAKGYHVEKVQPVDLFPHTVHVECIALIQRVKS